MLHPPVYGSQAGITDSVKLIQLARPCLFIIKPELLKSSKTIVTSFRYVGHSLPFTNAVYVKMFCQYFKFSTQQW